MNTTPSYATCPACGKKCATWSNYEIHLSIWPACRAVADADAAIRAEAARWNPAIPE